MTIVYIGLGSNLAGPRMQVERGLQALAGLADSRLVRHSRLYRTAPWGRADQPEFVNAVAQLETSLAAETLLAGLLGIERDAGRERDTSRWGPRVLDLDILVYGNRVLDVRVCTCRIPACTSARLYWCRCTRLLRAWILRVREASQCCLRAWTLSTCQPLETEDTA